MLEFPPVPLELKTLLHFNKLTALNRAKASR